ncbi:hypothetical protein [Deinococcus pimensis]|uniref:hypothetical protein n=1 Tax=Deinococcus pimensis TaxID=309888 RepID=UPI0004890023|nr:hypothetical protein [Deinococcus pimensis]
MATLTPVRFRHAAQALTTALTALFEATEAELDARARLERKETELLLSGRVEGTNERERRAWLRQHLTQEHESLEAAARVTRAARLQLEHARVKWDALRYGLRLLEATRHQHADTHEHERTPTYP